LIEKGTVDAETYVDDCIDQSGLIPEMDKKYGKWKWTLMQDGASAHTAASTMEYLKLYCNVLEAWPSGSPDLNPIENFWSIMKRRISEVGADTLEQLSEIIMAVWESVTPALISGLVGSMPRRLLATERAGGGGSGY
jgi:hypothetical protein